MAEKVKMTLMGVPATPEQVIELTEKLKGRKLTPEEIKEYLEHRAQRDAKKDGEK